jgi:catechol 2,3-dioxygenase-like lactoylglutathione lyase family enzyme
MRIGFVTVFVTDLEKSLRFYTETLGMELDYTDGKNWAQFKSGEDISLAIERCSPDHVAAGSRLVGRFVGVTLMIDDVVETFERLRAKGVEFTGRPEKQHWGGTLAHFEDLDGNVLTLMEGLEKTKPIDSSPATP